MIIYKRKKKINKSIANYEILFFLNQNRTFHYK